jgi:hypothetical protein
VFRHVAFVVIFVTLCVALILRRREAARRIVAGDSLFRARLRGDPDVEAGGELPELDEARVARTERHLLVFCFLLLVTSVPYFIDRFVQAN